MKYTGDEEVEVGIHKGTKWKHMHRNSLQYYVDNFDDGYMKQFAALEIKRRDKTGEF